jgi:hypothetical protein
VTIYKAFRWVQFFDVVSKVTCPDGHSIGTVETWGDGDLICSHRGKDGRDDCGKRIYLAPMLRFRGKALLMACEISAREMHELKNFKDADEILAHLGLKLSTRNAA